MPTTASKIWLRFTTRDQLVSDDGLLARSNSKFNVRMRCPTLAINTDAVRLSFYVFFSNGLCLRTPLEIVARYALHAVLQRAPFVAKTVQLRSGTVSAILHGKSDILSRWLTFPVLVITMVHNTNTKHTTIYYSAKDIEWSDTLEEVKVKEFKSPTGPTVPVPCSILETFFLLFTRDLIQYIAD